MTQDIYSHDNVSTTKIPMAPATRVRSNRRKSLSFAWLEEPYNHTRGEMSLWIAVITQAMMDALSRVNNAEAIYHKNEAIHWLTGNGKDFVMVCLCAGFDPDYIRRKAKRTLITPVAWRAEPRKGKRYLERKGYRNPTKRVKDNHHPAEDTPVQNKVITGCWAGQ